MGYRKAFLTAEWRNLVLLNYAVDRSLLEPFVPRGTEIDEFEGKSYLSLVGFEFNRTRLMGIRVPFHQAFEEVNLRFYVKRQGQRGREEKRGVVFIRELVPKRAVAAIARIAFNENYSRVPMSHRVSDAEAEYSWGSGSDRCSMRVVTERESFLPPDGSPAQFITERYWGYAAQRDGGCIEYEVQHEPWRVFSARQAALSGDASGFYGEGFARVLARAPDSAFAAAGSPVIVFKGVRIA